jgi:hypothetical protein
MQASKLTVSLHGYDNLTEWERHFHYVERYAKNLFKENRFAHATLDLANFQGSTPKQKTVYSFSMRLPENLP